MGTGILIQFLTGRYHANPWNHQVNEGIAEYPPSPWRILRALVAAYYRLVSPPPQEDLCQLVTSLAQYLPNYILPEYTTGHTRHYMPIWKEGKVTTTKVFDSFVVFPGGAFSLDAVVKVVWQDLELNQKDKALLALLCREVNYLGRAESWVEMQVIDNDIDGKNIADICNAFPAQKGKQLNLEHERVKVLVPLSALEMQGFLAAVAILPQPKKGKTTWKVPTDILSALSLDINNLHSQGWNGIPGARWVTYILQTPSRFIAQQPTEVDFLEQNKQPNFARFALASNVLPSVKEAVSLGERFRQALMAWSRDSLDRPAIVFSGRKPLNDIQSKNDDIESKSELNNSNNYLEGHQHAWYLPSVNHQGKIDHVVVYAASGFDYSQAVPALKNLSKIWGSEGFDIQTVLVNLGQVEDYATNNWQLDAKYTVVGQSRFWRSLTPMVLPRYPKCYRNGVKKFLTNTDFQIDGPEDQALRLLKNLKHLFIPTDCVKQALGTWLCLNAPDGSLIVKVRCCEQGVTQFRWQTFQRCRYHGDGRKSSQRGYWLEIEFASSRYGPIALGYAAHFGLGVFVPLSPINDVHLEV